MIVFDLLKGESGIIRSLGTSGSVATRLNSLGITAGKRVTVLSFSLFKGSVLIRCGTVRAGIRASIAKCIEVEAEKHTS